MKLRQITGSVITSLSLVATLQLSSVSALAADDPMPEPDLPGEQAGPALAREIELPGFAEVARRGKVSSPGSTRISVGRLHGPDHSRSFSAGKRGGMPAR